MIKPSATYNERSWAIDLIGHLKHLARQSNCSIKDAGGEQTIKSEGGSLFPDVLIFGDRSTARILQGWELKMPDTNIGDVEFRKNAEIKARALGLDSFLLWNVTEAHLYVRDASNDTFVRTNVWSELGDVTSRGEVVRNRARWEGLAEQIFDYLNDLFDRGALEGRQFIDAYRSGGVTSLIMENAGCVAESIVDSAQRDATFRAEMVLWWDRYQAEYAGGTMEYVLAQAVLSNWIGKILFGNILREKDRRAHILTRIGYDTTPNDALAMFQQLSDQCNFWTIFSNSIGLRLIPDSVWVQLKEFNSLLSDLRVGSVDQAQLSNILEATVEVAVRKLRGQYPTPIELARLLAHLCLRNIATDRVLDPCCGSGTIARAAMEIKLAAGVRSDKVAEQVFAGDQDPQAVQLATFALAKPALMNIPLRVFQRDAFGLEPETEIDFRNPSDGALFCEQLGQFQAITSNLPFVAQAGRKQYGNALAQVAGSLGESGEPFTRRADVAAYLPFSFHPMLAPEGRLGIIITNAWLGTDWGDAFFNALGRYYHLKAVVTSGSGRWFRNSDVVTNILLLERKVDSNQPSCDIKFVVLKRPLEELADEESVRVAAAQIELGQTQNDTMTIRVVTNQQMAMFRRLGLGGNAQFVDCDWILSLPLVPLNSLFRIRRGERRGMNKLFYPASGHEIEPVYIKPLAKSPVDFTHLSGRAVKEAFSCSRSKEELKSLGHVGALRWIERFETPEVVKKLQTSNLMWYEMPADTLTDLVMFINYGDRLFVGRVNPPAFADQRLVRLDPIGDVDIDIDLMHALLNSAIGMFIMEGMGFGRGLGALDLNKDRIENFMHVLDASQLDQPSIDAIKSKFAPLLERKILDVADELEQADRVAFDDAVITAFGLGVDRQRIYDALLSLVEIRQTAMEYPTLQ